MPKFLTLDSFQNVLNGKVALVRADLNVPWHEGRITDTTRLERLRTTINDLRRAGAKVVILSHFGRPKGAPDPALSLRPVAEALGRVLALPVAFAEDCQGPVAQKAVAALAPGEILVLENVRFHPGEEKNDLTLARAFAALGDVFVNDAFSAAHRAHASTTALADLVPACAGRLMQAELEALGKALEHPERPIVGVVGGAKISTKLDLLKNLLDAVDILIPGGGMANTFLAALGHDVGASLCERDMLETARAILHKATHENKRVFLPSEVVVRVGRGQGAVIRTVPVTAVPPDGAILDIGPRGVEDIQQALSVAKTVVWNGPLGVFEEPPFDRGTTDVARLVADLTQQGKIVSVAGGGDTVAALTHAGVAEHFSYLSTAGGAFLEWLEGKTLPGVAALARAKAPSLQEGVT